MINKSAIMLLLFSSLIIAVADDYDQQRAFNDAKNYKGSNDSIKNNINQSTMDKVPGQDASTTNDLKGLYGSDLLGKGDNKVSDCAAYKPTTDAYKNQECDTVNFIRKNPSERPTYTIDKKNDPIVSKGTTIANSPYAHTSGASGLTGSYTACYDKTTRLPAQYESERCQVGHEITEGYCPVVLRVTYQWELFTNQKGADTRYGRCNGLDVRGDRLQLAQTNTYETEGVQCSDFNLGAGSGSVTYAVDCYGKRTLVGYDASSCEIKPSPPSVVASQNIQSCTNAPRVIENCFTPDGIFTTKTTVPVFTDTLDDSACTELHQNGAVIK